MKWFRNSLPFFVIGYAIIWFVVILNITEEPPFLAPLAVMILGVVFTSDIDDLSDDARKIDSFLIRSLFSVVMVGLFINEIITSITLNQFGLVFLGTYFTLELSIHKIKPLKNLIISVFGSNAKD
ncbi:hypothetical protein ACFOU0_08210 [Salinicoccus sesuvii]|uniref:Uncharacterized protein n=1 Tax=Salinicoccus sesuvii TaxID=868281 RepID=A0ABV7N7L0_9STAP